jgi:hypothetical protein
VLKLGLSHDILHIQVSLEMIDYHAIESSESVLIGLFVVLRHDERRRQQCCIIMMPDGGNFTLSV